MDIHICKAKSLDTREWVIGYYFYDGYQHQIMREDNHETVGIIFDTICRYIGHNDIEENPIFEYDIVIEDRVLCEVVYMRDWCLKKKNENPLENEKYYYKWSDMIFWYKTKIASNKFNEELK